MKTFFLRIIVINYSDVPITIEQYLNQTLRTVVCFRVLVLFVLAHWLSETL